MGKAGKQTPTFTNVNYKKSLGKNAIKSYTETGQKLYPWQQKQINAIMAVENGLWQYMTYCLSLSRRNGKGEVLAARELAGITQLNEKICHTAHRTTTSHDAFERLYRLLKQKGYVEHSKKKKDMPAKSFFASKQYGLEHIEVNGGGIIDFRTRTNNGGLGEGFDLLVIDEAQEYTSKQESALLYTVSASKNPQTILTGTPPTATSQGDVFGRIRGSIMDGTAYDTGWAEWSIPKQTANITDPKIWYLYNPSLGHNLTERNIRAEVATGEVDFNVQRLGLWLDYKQDSAISLQDWRDCEINKLPDLEPRRYFGVKYGRDMVNVALSVASKTTDGHIYVEFIEMQSIRNGTEWLTAYFKNPKTQAVIIDGASGQTILAEAMSEAKIKKKPIMPKVQEIITANAMFEAGIRELLQHREQQAVTQVATNCKKRAIGNGGGFGFESMVKDADIAILDSMILAFWRAATDKPKKPQTINY